MTYTEWITRVKKYRVMQYMRLTYKEKSTIRNEYVEWYKKTYHKDPVHISI